MTSAKIVVVAISLVTVPATAHAQNRQFALELNPVHLTLGYGWRTGETSYLGWEIGAGYPTWDLTLLSEGGSILEVAHLGVFLRTEPRPGALFDATLTAGVGGDRQDCSGCFPADGGYVALGGGMFFGGSRLKIGTRLRAGYTRDRSRDGEFFINLTPVALLLTFHWTRQEFPF